MPLLENGQLKEEIWQVAIEGEALPEGNVLVPLARLPEALGRNSDGALGVLLAPDEDVEALRIALPRLTAVQLTFPIFRDGRAFTQARALREHLHFKGVIRAAGHILPDQYEFLLRCGVTEVVVPEKTDVSMWERAHKAFTVAYQPSILNEASEGVALRRYLSR
ncbi:DUF934 domain-containing protein [Acetobacter orientalis]|uniref:DUF934 domain-containing protein n=1 Tax=Acetobacter orientalis TaxID=146474 RepID=UPI0039E9F03F